MHQNVKKWLVKESCHPFIRAKEHYLLISQPAAWQGASSLDPQWPPRPLSVISSSQAFFFSLTLLPSLTPPSFFWLPLTRAICLSYTFSRFHSRRRWPKATLCISEGLALLACSLASGSDKSQSFLVKVKVLTRLRQNWQNALRRRQPFIIRQRGQKGRLATSLCNTATHFNWPGTCKHPETHNYWHQTQSLY